MDGHIEPFLVLKSDKLFEENFGDGKTNYNGHGRITISNLDQARQAAINFARSVS
jgi:hypothetical protein